MIVRRGTSGWFEPHMLIWRAARPAVARWYHGIGKWWLRAYLFVLGLPVLPMLAVKLYRYITQLYPCVSNIKIDPLYWATDYSAITLYAIFLLPITLAVWLQVTTIIIEQFRGVLVEIPIPHVLKLRRAAFDLIGFLGLLAIIAGQAGYILKPLRIWILGMPRLEAMLNQPGMPHVYSPGLPMYIMMGLLWFCLAFMLYQGRPVIIQRLGIVMLALTTLLSCISMFATYSIIYLLRPISSYVKSENAVFSPLLDVEHFEYFWILGLVIGIALILSLVHRRHGSLAILTVTLLISSLFGALAPTNLSKNTLLSIRKFVEQQDEVELPDAAATAYIEGPDHLPITPATVVNRAEVCLHSIWYGTTSPLFDLVFTNLESPIDGDKQALIMSPVPVRWGMFLPMNCFWIYWLGNLLYVFVVFLIMRLISNASQDNLSMVRYE